MPVLAYTKYEKKCEEVWEAPDTARAHSSQLTAEVRKHGILYGLSAKTR